MAEVGGYLEAESGDRPLINGADLAAGSTRVFKTFNTTLQEFEPC